MLDVRLPDGDGITVCRELRSVLPVRGNGFAMRACADDGVSLASLGGRQLR